jgi:hypothetical protein
VIRHPAEWVRGPSRRHLMHNRRSLVDSFELDDTRGRGDGVQVAVRLNVSGNCAPIDFGYLIGAMTFLGGAGASG